MNIDGVSHQRQFAVHRKETEQDEAQPIGNVRDTERDVWSHPSLVGNRLYIRNLLGVYCFFLSRVEVSTLP